MKDCFEKEQTIVKRKKIKIDTYKKGAYYFIYVLMLSLTPIFANIDTISRTPFMQKYVMTKGKSVFVNRYIKKEEIIKAIRNSNLKEEEKEYLINSNFIDDFTKYVKDKRYDCDIVINNMNNLHVREMSEEYSEQHPGAIGCVNVREPGIINIKNYNSLTPEEIYESLPHEFIHLLQYGILDSGTFICEASAELLAREYYRQPKTLYYEEEVKVLKMIAETIGKDALEDLIYRGKIEVLEKEISQYLEKEETEELIRRMTSPEERKDNEVGNAFKIRALVAKLFENKYGYNMYEDEVMLSILL